jgi:hypothetical protein
MGTFESERTSFEKKSFSLALRRSPSPVDASGTRAWTTLADLVAKAGRGV